MSQTDANSTGGESGRGGHTGHTGTGCFRNHDHSMHGTNRLMASDVQHHRPSSHAQHRRQSCTAAVASGAVSIAAVTALLTSSPATNVSGAAPGQANQHHQKETNNLVDLGNALES